MNNNVPEFKVYYASESTMNSEQKNFYKYWLDQWKKNKTVAVDGQISYLFAYLLSLQLPVDELIKTLNKMISAYNEELKFVWYCQWWLSDCYVLKKDYEVAVLSFPKIPINSTATHNTNQLLSLKVAAKKRISGYDILTLTGPKVTQFGKKNIKEVSEFLETIIRCREKNENINLLEKWIKNTPVQRYYLFGGSPNKLTIENAITEIPYYSFADNLDVLREISNLTREAENTVREEMGISKIGEGWVSETELYYKIRNHFRDLEIIQHARPKWLGHQHLDIFIPSLKLAIEYQGFQHFQPIEYFGGEKAFRATLKRDLCKKIKCTKKRHPFDSSQIWICIREFNKRYFSDLK